ncbi:MAG: flagellar basal body-associated FliL family protein [Lachnospiraceae bacterium]|nr:flagellar basal body-associated FliL family protein [Lachnospiraceae bacterium]
MKKNILAIIILAATIVNIALTALMLFTVIPKAQRTDALIQKIVSIIDLELENPDAADYAEIGFEDREVYSLANKVVVNLARKAGESKNPFAQVTVNLVLNKTSESYETVQPLIAGYEPIIQSIVSEEVSKYTVDTLGENKTVIQEAVLSRLRTEFEAADLVIGVDLFMTYESR